MSRARPLTTGERQLAAAWLPPGFVPAAVRLRCGRFLPGQPDTTAITPFGVPYFPVPVYRGDYATAELPLQALFIHELVHVWQHQQGRAVAWRGLLLHLWFAGRDPYTYRLQPGRPLRAYNLEQQARIVEDGFRIGHGGTACCPQPTATLADYRGLVQAAG